MTTRFQHLLLVLALSALAPAPSAWAQEDKILTTVDEAPVATKMLPPAYPDSLKASKVAGLVAVSAVIDEGGNVVSCEIVKATNDAFKQPALEAAKTWKFKPAKHGGVPVKVRVTLPLRFTPPA